MESYVSAGLTPSATARVVGRFNVSWVLAVPLSLVVCGPIIDVWPRGLFLLAALLNAASLLMLRPLAARPVHLPADHPERPVGTRMARYRSLLLCSRWQMLGSYGAMAVLAALMPRIFGDLGFGVGSATALAGVMDVFRVAAFVGLQVYVGWHFRVRPLLLTLLAVPPGFS